jgi:hypothetical protein
MLEFRKFRGRRKWRRRSGTSSGERRDGEKAEVMGNELPLDKNHAGAHGGRTGEGRKGRGQGMGGRRRVRDGGNGLPLEKNHVGIHDSERDIDKVTIVTFNERVKIGDELRQNTCGGIDSGQMISISRYFTTNLPTFMVQAPR